MNDQKQVWSVRRTAAVLTNRVNKAKKFAEVKSAILDFLTAMDAEDCVLADDDFAALLDAALICRGKTAVQPQSDLPSVAISAVL
jgi:hypothetical protein